MQGCRTANAEDMNFPTRKFRSSLEYHVKHIGICHGFGHSKQVRHYPTQSYNRFTIQLGISLELFQILFQVTAYVDNRYVSIVGIVHIDFHRSVETFKLLVVCHSRTRDEVLGDSVPIRLGA